MSNKPRILGVKGEGEEASSQITMLKIEQLIVTSKNPRILTQEGYEALKRSIKEDEDFLYSRPILVNKVNGMYVIYGGAQRFKVCQELGYKEVPCIIAENLSHSTVDYRILADNAHLGEWDTEKLLADFPVEVDMLAFEFNGQKLNKLINKSAKEQDADKDAKGIQTLKLTFDTKDEFNEFYEMLGWLHEQYPEVTVSQRIKNFLLTEEDNPE